MPTVFLRETAPRYFRYRRAIAAAGGQICSDGDPLRCDALLLPGGGDAEPWRYGQQVHSVRDADPQRDAAELDLLDQFITLGKPVLGICRGLQIINICFGGTLLQDISGHDPVSGADRLHPVRTAPSALRSFCGSSCTVNSAHHQAADRLGNGLRALQWADDGIVEALSHSALPVLALQWHPERMDSPNLQRFFAWFLSGFR